MDELPLDQVRTLLAVVDEGTFDAAAAALHVTPSAVSQRVKALEQRTGRVLLMRTKPVRATESGEVVVRFARQLARLERDARAELGMADGMGPVRLPIAVNADSLATWFLPALARVPQDPPVSIELHREDESHTTALLREGQVMAAVTSSPDPVAGCSVRMLGLVRYLPTASPAFAARYLTGEPERDLREAPTIVFDRKDDLQDAFVRALTGTRRLVRGRYGTTYRRRRGSVTRWLRGSGGVWCRSSSRDRWCGRGSWCCWSRCGRWTSPCTGSSGGSTRPLCRWSRK